MNGNRLIPGDYYSLGAHWDGEGVNFSLFSAHAEQVELCLFDEPGKTETARYTLPDQTHDIWHGYLPGLEPGARYGYRVYGPHDPQAGHRFNHHKLLLDPYARQLAGTFSWTDEHFGYVVSDPAEDLSFDTRDNAAWMPKCVVTAPGTAASERPAKTRTPWHETTIYELHVRGYTQLHPEIPQTQRGTFAGLCRPEIINYLKDLGVTSIELLPVHAFVDERFLVDMDLTNYWGYNTLGYFAPHARYLAGEDPGEFRRMVDSYHDAGLEVILDVVYNHTCEGNRLGPTLSFRGIDNFSYYRLQAEQPRYYVNDTGCGNTLDISHPRVMQMVMDSLRYWAGEMGVDGFRFDLATVQGREPHGFNQHASFFQALSQDPLLSRSKVIAEPWDIGPGGYQLGSFPAGWSEWNDSYRDTVRRFWRREPGHLPTLARRLHGSSDIFEHSGRKPFASINYITSHDGFTLHDLVSYADRHNHANGADNNDGHRENFGENFGIEGPTDNEEISAARRRQVRNMLATLLLSQGVPMIQSGDERSRTQRGNNNAYCQDNELSWIDWRSKEPHPGKLTAFVSRILRLRREHPVLRHPNYMHSPPEANDSCILWFNSDGQPMRDEHWAEHHSFLLGYLLSPGEEWGRDELLVILNSASEKIPFRLPACGNDREWQWLLDTTQEDGIPLNLQVADGSVYIEPRSVAILHSAERHADETQPPT